MFALVIEDISDKMKPIPIPVAIKDYGELEKIADRLAALLPNRLSVAIKKDGETIYEVEGGSEGSIY